MKYINRDTLKAQANVIYELTINNAIEWKEGVDENIRERLEDIQHEFVNAKWDYSPDESEERVIQIGRAIRDAIRSLGISRRPSMLNYSFISNLTAILDLCTSDVEKIG